jgi:hypothetical protein
MVEWTETIPLTWANIGNVSIARHSSPSGARLEDSAGGIGRLCLKRSFSAKTVSESRAQKALKIND